MLLRVLAVVHRRRLAGRGGRGLGHLLADVLLVELVPPELVLVKLLELLRLVRGLVDANVLWPLALPRTRNSHSRSGTARGEFKAKDFHFVHS